MRASIDTVLGALRARSGNEAVRKISAIDWTAPCPTCAAILKATDAADDWVTLYCPSGCQPAEVEAALRKHLPRNGRGVAKGKAPKGSATSATPKLRRLDVGRMVREQAPEVNWLVDQLVVSGMLTMLHGREGQGKSMLAMALAAGVHLGEAQAGMACRRGKVVYVDAENGESEIHRRVHTLGLPEGVVVVEADGFDLRHDLSQLEEVVSEESPDLVVLDSFRSLWRGKEKDDGEVAAALDPLRNLVHRYGFGALLLHHSRRMDNDYRGSSAIGASTELGFGLGRVEGDPDSARRLLKTTGKCRPAADPPNRWLRLSAERGMVLIDQAEPFESDDAPVGRPPVVSNGIAPQVLEALATGPTTQADVARSLGRKPSDGTVRRVLESLQGAGDVERLDGGKWALPDCQIARTPIGNGTSGNAGGGHVEGSSGIVSVEAGSSDGLDDLGPEQPPPDLAPDAERAPPCKCERPKPWEDEDGRYCLMCSKALRAAS